MNKKTVTKWTITASTISALMFGGYKVGEFNEEKGYPVIDTVTVTETVIDTVWFKDSTKLANFAVLGKARLGHCRLGAKK